MSKKDKRAAFKASLARTQPTMVGNQRDRDRAIEQDRKAAARRDRKADKQAQDGKA